VPDAVRKLPFSYHRFALSLATSFFMTFLVSGVATYRALGPGHSMFGIWMESWMVSWMIACPTMFFVMPRVRRLLDRFIEVP
jgi:Protein of unknown function (DUF2798)